MDESNGNGPNRPARQWTAGKRVIDVRDLRRRMGITQAQFAGWFGFPVATLRHWERGNRRPAGAALVLLCAIADNPRAVRRAVMKARAMYPGALASQECPKSYRAPPGFGDPRIPIRRRRTPRV